MLEIVAGLIAIFSAIILLKPAGESEMCGLSWCRSFGATAWAANATRPGDSKKGQSFDFGPP